jgi:hypothetical protein
MRLLAQVIVGIALALVAVFWSLVEAFHAVEFLQRFLPPADVGWITPMHNLEMFLAGLLLIGLTWLEHKTKSRESSTTTRPAHLTPSGETLVHTSPTATASPHVEVKPEVSIAPTIHNEINFHPPASKKEQKPSPALTTVVAPKHNVTFIGGVAYDHRIHGTCFGDSPMNVRCVLAEFRNKHILGKTVAAAEYVKAVVTYKDSQGNEVLFLSPCVWLNEDSDVVTLEPGGEPKCVLLALYDYEDKQWRAMRPIRQRTSWGDEGHSWDPRALPFGVITADIALIEDSGNSVPGGTVKFDLRAGGVFEVLPLETS